MVNFCNCKLHSMPSTHHFELLEKRLSEENQDCWYPFRGICLDAASRRLDAAGQHAYTAYRSTERMPGRGRPCVCFQNDTQQTRWPAFLGQTATASKAASEILDIIHKRGMIQKANVWVYCLGTYCWKNEQA